MANRIKVKCIKPDGTVLVRDKIYEVVREYYAPIDGEKRYELLELKRANAAVDDYGWNAYRFEIVPEEVKQSTAPVSSKKDVEEERLWKLMRPSLAPNECPCGGTLGVCKFHPKV